MTLVAQKSRRFLAALFLLPALLGCGAEPDSQLSAETCNRDGLIIKANHYEVVNMEPADFNCLHGKILSNGLQTSWFDANNFKGKVTYNAAYSFVNTPLELVTELTHDRLAHAIAARPQYGIVRLDSHVKDGKVIYHAIFQRGFVPDRVYYHVSAAEHERLIDVYFKEGMKVETITVASVNGKRFYSAIYRKAADSGQLVRTTHKVFGFQALFDEMKAGGRELTYRSAYIHNGESYYIALFEKLNGNYTSKSSMTEADLRAEISKRADPKDNKLANFAPYEFNNQIHYSATWRK